MTHTAMPTGFSDPIVTTDPKAFEAVRWLRISLSTGSGIRRVPLRPETAQGVFEEYAHIPAPRIRYDTVAAGDLSPRVVASSTYIRSIEVFGEEVDEFGNEAHPHPGAIFIDNYRRAQWQRLDFEGTRRRYIHGVTFGGPERFTAPITTPEFDDVFCEGLIRVANRNRTEWNNYPTNANLDQAMIEHPFPAVRRITAKSDPHTFAEIAKRYGCAA